MKCFIDDIEIYYEEFGKGKPILCIHGYCENSQMMKGCVEPVLENNNNYRRIYIDLPGMGKSTVNSRVKNADIMIKILQEFIEKIIGKESFLVIAQSYGGYLALGVLLKMLNQIDGIFLLCPCIVPSHKLRLLPNKEIIVQETQFKNTKDKIINNFLEYAVVATDKTFERYQKEILPGLLEGNKEFLERYQKTGYECSFMKEIYEIKYEKPISILTGRQDHCVGYKDSFNILKLFPRATFSILDSAGHHLQIEKPYLFNAHLADWIGNL